MYHLPLCTPIVHQWFCASRKRNLATSDSSSLAVIAPLSNWALSSENRRSISAIDIENPKNPGQELACKGQLPQIIAQGALLDRFKCGVMIKNQRVSNWVNARKVAMT